MNGENRRVGILQKLQNSSQAIPGSTLAKEFGVSRQIIVNDVALLRAQGMDIVPTHRGYILKENKPGVTRVFKVIHSEEEAKEEMQMVVDQGGALLDVFIYHRVYGVIRGELNIRSRRDITNYLKEIQNGKSKLLSRSTSGYHYHTIQADSAEILDEIHQKLADRGFLAPIQPDEPVPFVDAEQ